MDLDNCETLLIFILYCTTKEREKRVLQLSEELDYIRYRKGIDYYEDTICYKRTD